MPALKIRRLVSLALAATCALAVTPAPARAQSDTLVFGAALAVTGRDAREGVLTKEGYEFWKDYVNAHGGLKAGGKKYKVEIRYADDETNAQTSAKLVEKFINEDHVNFILGPYGSATSFHRLRWSNVTKFPWSRETAAPRRSSVKALSISLRSSRPHAATSKASSTCRCIRRKSPEPSGSSRPTTSSP